MPSLRALLQRKAPIGAKEGRMPSLRCPPITSPTDCPERFPIGGTCRNTLIVAGLWAELPNEAEEVAEVGALEDEGAVFFGGEAVGLEAAFHGF